MNRSEPEAWSRVAETALLSLVFLAPLAVHTRTYDAAALKTALLQASALTLGLAWLLKGLARGRWDAPAAAWTALAPVLALAAWTLARFAVAPYKAGVLPGLVLAGAAWLVYSVSLLEFGGARHAARFSFWTTAAAALVCAYGVAQKLGFDPMPWKGAFGPRVFSTLGGDAALSYFAALALPVVLSARLDPEATPTRRLLSGAASAGLAMMAGWAGSARGLAAFGLSAFAFSGAAALILRGPAARRAAIEALACAAGAAVLAVAGGGGIVEDGARAVVESRRAWSSALSLWVQRPLVGHGPGSFDLRSPGLDASADSLIMRELAETGLIGAVLLVCAVLAAAAGGLRAAWELRRRGAPAEAGYAAAFAAAFAAWAAAAGLGLTASSGPAAWLAWAAAGIAAGMLPLSRPHAVVRTLPLPFGEDVRRLMRGPVMLVFLGLLAWPGLWLASDVSFNLAREDARLKNYDAALAAAGSVWPGSPLYARALYLRGQVLLAQGKAAPALDAYAQLDGVAPDFARVHARKAEAFAALGDWPASARERARQDGLTPADVGNLVAWAEAARAAGDLGAARRAAARARALAPGEESVRVAAAENALLEKKLAERDGARRRSGRQGLALKPKPR